jgi:hypothetical protein
VTSLNLWRGRARWQVCALPLPVEPPPLRCPGHTRTKVPHSVSPSHRLPHSRRLRPTSITPTGPVVTSRSTMAGAMRCSSSSMSWMSELGSRMRSTGSSCLHPSVRSRPRYKPKPPSLPHIPQPPRHPSPMRPLRLAAHGHPPSRVRMSRRGQIRLTTGPSHTSRTPAFGHSVAVDLPSRSRTAGGWHHEARVQATREGA